MRRFGKGVPSQPITFLQRLVHPGLPTFALVASGSAHRMSLPDRPTGGEADFAEKASLYESKIDAAGFASMVPVEGVEIPAGETITLVRGGNITNGLHVLDCLQSESD